MKWWKIFFGKNINVGVTGKDLLGIVDNFMAVNKIVWAHCVGVCTDGAHSVAGCYNDLKALILS